MNKINIFNIPTYYNFLEALYYWLEENFSNQSQSLSQENAPIIILPSNLAVKEFKKIIAKNLSIEQFNDFLVNTANKKAP